MAKGLGDILKDAGEKIQAEAERIRKRAIFTYYWDGQITAGEKEMERFTDEELKRLVIQGNLMVTAAANIRQRREKAKEDQTDGVG